MWYAARGVMRVEYKVIFREAASFPEVGLCAARRFAPGDLHDLTFAHDKDAVACRRAIAAAAGETAERGQDGLVGADDEAAFARRYAAGSMKRDGRVEMSGKAIAAVRSGGGVWLMGEAEGAECGSRGKRRDGEACGRRAGVGVVVAGHKADVQVGVARAPCGKLIEHALALAFFGVEEIAQDDQAAGGVTLHKRAQACQVMFKQFGGNGNARGVKSGRFAKVWIGDEQGAAFGPKERAARVEMDFDGLRQFMERNVNRNRLGHVYLFVRFIRLRHLRVAAPCAAHGLSKTRCSLACAGGRSRWGRQRGSCAGGW